MVNIIGRLAVLLDLPRDIVRIDGADHIAFLHNLCTNDIRKLRPQESCEAFFANVQGKLVGHGIVYRHHDHAWIVTSPGQGDRLAQHLDRYIIREDVQLANLSGKFQHTLLSGVDSDAWLHRAFSEGSFLVPAASGDATNAAVDCQSFSVNDISVTVRTCPYLPTPTYLLEYSSLPVDAANPVGALATNSLITCQEYELARIMTGWPEFGVDIDERNLPQEVARNSSAISFRKGCYLGQETVARIDALGHVNQELRGLIFSASADIAPGTTLQIGEKSVGRVTSCMYDPNSDQTFALAYLRREYLQGDSPVEFVHGRARVVMLPITDLLTPT